MFTTGNVTEHTNAVLAVCKKNGGKYKDKLRVSRGEGSSHDGSLLEVV